MGTAVVVALAMGAAVWLAAAWPASGAAAQDGAQGGTGRETGFVAVTGPAQESVPGGVLVVAAYALVLALLGGYVARLAMLQARTQRELERLERAVDGAGQASGAQPRRAEGAREAGG